MLDLICSMIKRAAIAAAVLEFQRFADDAFLDQAMRGLLTGIRLAGQAVLWLGRALMMNPIGLAVGSA